VTGRRPVAETAPIAASQAASRARTYRADILVRFAHCDPAGIVFFPRYMEMFNNLVEDWCRDELGFSFAEIHLGRGWGLPTVHLEVDFLAPSVVGEVLTATVAVRSLGTSSIGLSILLQGPDGGDRVRAQTVLVLTEAHSRRPVPIPADLRARLSVFHAPD
jgi:4-hydroxybenzoyl-CoA thioesterase